MNESIDTSSGRARSTVAIVVPAWNEAEIITETVAALRDGLEEIGRAGEVVVVDDASDDSTGGPAVAAGGRGWCGSRSGTSRRFETPVRPPPKASS